MLLLLPSSIVFTVSNSVDIPVVLNTVYYSTSEQKPMLFINYMYLCVTDLESMICFNELINKLLWNDI